MWAGSTGINFKGFLAGNPSTDFQYDGVAIPLVVYLFDNNLSFVGSDYWPFMYSHALVGSQEYNNAEKQCDGNFNNQNAVCVQAIKAMRLALNRYPLLFVMKGGKR